MLILLWLVLSSMRMAGEVSPRFFRNYSAADGLADNSAQVVLSTKTGRIVIATMGQINFYDGQRFIFIDPTDENTFPLSNYHGNYHLYFDRFHHIWLKNKQSVTCVDLVTERFVQSVESEFQKFGVEQKVIDLFVDHDGIVWLMTSEGLINVKSRQSVKVRKDLNLQDMDIYKDEFLLLFFENGLVEMVDLKSGQVVHESTAYGEADRDRFRKTSVLLPDGDGFYQIRNGKGGGVLNRFDVVKRTWHEVMRTPYRLNNMALHDSLLYIPSDYGFWTFNMASGEKIHYETLKLQGGRLLQTDINVMAFDRQGGLWLGTENRGLMYSQPYQSPFNVIGWDHPRAATLAKMMDPLEVDASFKGRTVNCLLKDSRKWTWVGTAQGLQLYRKSTDVLPQIISKRDGLLNNVIHSIVEDKMHNIWVATSYGISCVQVDGERVSYVNSYNSYDNIPNEIFVKGRAMCMPDGEVVMQTLDHLVTFYPERMMTLKESYPFEIYPKLIRILVNGNEIRTGQEYDGRVILEKAISRTAEIDLDYSQNSASLVFSALNFFRPQQTCYRVRIKGLIDDWKVYTTYNSGGLVDSRGLLHLPLMALPPGTYTIELQTSMVPDRWETKPYEWVVRINEPWWRTTGVFLLFSLVLLVLLGVNLYFWFRNVDLRARQHNGERTIIKRIYGIARRCSEHPEIVLEPLYEEVTGQDRHAQEELDPKFVAVMEKILPFVNSQNQDKLSMRILSEEAGLDTAEFYQLISDNIFKNHRPLFMDIMQKRAEQMLKDSSKSIGEIAEACGFISANYFIASFFRTHRMTPSQYREML